ncbi:MAG: hypothetical protein K2G67_06450 [Muribaculaceae bacterium]|nr:hypothetical protein [Muribaculaceae bacterium]
MNLDTITFTDRDIENNGNLQPVYNPNSRYLNLPYFGKGAHPIVLAAAYPNLGSSILEEKACRELHDCGITHAIMSIGLTNISSAIDRAADWNIKTILCHNHLGPDDNRTLKEQLELCTGLVNTFRNKAGLAGYCIGLPKLSVSPEIAKLFNGRIVAADPAVEGEVEPGNRHIIQFLLPDASSYISPSNLSYEDYLKQVEQYLRPAVWVVDCDIHTDYYQGWTVIRYQEFFNALATFEMMSRYTNRPFWVKVRCNTFSPNGSLITPSLGKMRFAALSALGYGAQGIVYSPFRQQTESDGPAALSVAGTGTAIWEDIQEVNSTIERFQRVFAGSQLMEVAHTQDISPSSTIGFIPFDDSPISANGSNTPTYYSRLKEPIGPLLNVTGTRRGVQVSHLCCQPTEGEEDASDFLMIVNHGVESNQIINLELNPFYTVEKVTSAFWGKPIITEPLTTNRHTLEPGDCLILKWK